MRRGFTLLELIVVITILGALVAMVSPNYMTSLKRGRDLKRKGELSNLKTALQLYNIDYGRFPNGSGAAGTPPYGINGCGLNGTSTCNVTSGTCTATHFGAGNASCTTTVYMSKLPAGYGNAGNEPMQYYATASQSNFCILQELEITTDTDIATSQAKCTVPCTGVTVGTNYVVCNE